MLIARCVTKPTDTHSEHVILIACPLQQWLRYTSIAYHVITFMPFLFLHLLMDLIRINLRTALAKGENDRVLRSYTVTYILSVCAIDYYINKN
jgi:ABC-type sulfate transport system permease component